MVRVFWVRRPRPKKISSLSPGLVKESIPSILLQLHDKLYDDPPPCPRCRSEERKRHGQRKRLYAAIIVEDRFQRIRVWVKRYVCKRCGKAYRSRSPFYPGCLYGNLVVDTCLFLASANPFCRVEAILQEWGLQIDRDTVRCYVHRFRARARSMAGVRVDTASVAVNLVRLLYDAADVEELRQRMPWEVFQDVADETYPAVKGAKKRLREENLDRSLRGELPRRYPESHTLACCYETRHRFFASILVTSTAFNTMLADALTRPAKGCVGSVRDGSRCYRGPHIDCVNHKARRGIARDPAYRRLKKEAESRDQIQEYCVQYYSNVRREEEEKAAKAYPELVDKKGRFTGALSTNSMEGGNWRIKFALRVPYEDPASVEGRTLLAAVSDSVRTFKSGRPDQSFAQIHGSFSYFTVMSHTYRDHPAHQTPGSGDKGQGGGDDHSPASEKGHTKRHTEKFTLWLVWAVERAKRKHEEREATTTTTS